MQGYAGLHQAQNSTSAEQGKQAVQIAVGNLFQAMAVFHTANQPTQYGQQKDLTDSCNMIKHVIHDILVGLTGSCNRPGPQVAHSALHALLAISGLQHCHCQQATASSYTKGNSVSQPHCSLFVAVKLCSPCLCTYMLLLKAVMACADCMTQVYMNCRGRSCST